MAKFSCYQTLKYSQLDNETPVVINIKKEANIFINNQYTKSFYMYFHIEFSQPFVVVTKCRNGR